MLGKTVGTYQGMGKFNSQIFGVEGLTKYFQLGNKYNGTPLIKDKAYELTTWQTEGKKTVYINEAKEVGSQTLEVGAKVTPSPTSPVNHVPEATKKAVSSKVEQTDKMSREDWAKKDEGIKWLTCLKASADFYSRRTEADILTVINSARLLYKATPTTEANSTDNIPESGF